MQQMKKGSSGPPSRCSTNQNQGNPDGRRLRRGETVEVSCPSASLGALPRLRERPLGRCHTLDPGQQTPEPTHTPHTPENSPQERDQTADAHTHRDHAQHGADETHSTGGVSSSSPPSPPSPSDGPFERRPTHAPPAPCAPHDATKPSDPTSQSLRSVNGGSESPDAHANNEVLRSEDTDGDSGPPCTTIQSDGGDQRPVDPAPERGGESNHGGCS
ncbi:proline-rich receptor-like protein kinase PERK12 [Etheostoma cragini]|uniref:proline-rich receptor-like protein kinase PERK12 n=1 Tax=Etheostoma cragini TaxID=417921 RepID=UPI00155DF4E3|nr:proline-rich receptor-like protein kinase PERK12 [Etheostoma cragini]